MVRNGLDRLAGDFAHRFRDFRVGLVANSASVSSSGVPAWEALSEAGFRMTCLYAAEHGMRLEHYEGERFGGYFDEASGLEVRSLYDEGRKIDSRRFDGVDLLIYDLPQVGCRFYTYLDTLVSLLLYCHGSGLPILVLDRPNPLRADRFEGPVPRQGRRSPFGPERIPVRFGLTMGEFARFFVMRHRLDTRLSVISMEGYERGMWFEDTGLRWVPPSPALASLDAVRLYPGTCLFEGTWLSEGRGTAEPFELFGAPWLDTERLVPALQALELPGLAFEPCRFTPGRSKYAGTDCNGIRLVVTDRNALEPVGAVLDILSLVRGTCRDREFWIRDRDSGDYFLDLLLCDDRYREAMDGGGVPPRLLAECSSDIDLYIRDIEPALVYEK